MTRLVPEISLAEKTKKRAQLDSKPAKACPYCADTMPMDASYCGRCGAWIDWINNRRWDDNPWRKGV